MCGLINTGITQLHLKTSSKTSKHSILTFKLNDPKLQRPTPLIND